MGIIFNRLMQYREFLKANGLVDADQELLKFFPGLKTDDDYPKKQYELELFVENPTK